MSYKLRKISNLEAEEIVGVSLSDMFVLYTISRRMPDGQVCASMSIVNIEDRNAAAAMVRMAKDKLRKKTDAEWKHGIRNAA